MQMKVQKQQSTAHNSKNETWTTAGYEKGHQNTAGTQANYASTKVQMKVQKQQSTAHDRKNDTWTTAGYEKNRQNAAGTQANYASTRMQMKVQKLLRATEKMIRELPPDMKKVIKTLWAHKLITKAQRMQMKVQKQQKYCAQQQK